MDRYNGHHPNRTKQRGSTTVVYALVDPRDGEVRYIGITNSILGRFKEHMRMYGGNERKNAWLRELLDAHMLPLMHTLEVVADASNWRDRELAWIQTYQERGADLLNDELHRFDGGCLEAIQHNADSGAKKGQTARRLSLPDLPDYQLGVEGEINPFDATDLEFLQFVQSLVPLTGDNLDHWTWEDRRDFLNWCLDEQVLTIRDGRLVPVEEQVVTAPLSEHSEAVSNATEESPGSTEDAGFLHNVERATSVIRANPEIGANELADALGLKSAAYAHTLKVFVNAHLDQEKGVQECSRD